MWTAAAAEEIKVRGKNAVRRGMPIRETSTRVSSSLFGKAKQRKLVGAALARNFWDKRRGHASFLCLLVFILPLACPAQG
jgi:hypothetical protein